jgi:alkylation response protein AidB-like acyl-CoA dehydrogenase
MDFALSDEQEMVRDTARALFERECDIDFVRRAWQEEGEARSLWEDHLSEWMDLATNDLVDIALFMEEHGRAAAPGVLFASLLASQVAEAAGLTLGGSATVAISGEDGLWIPNSHSTKHFVPSLAEVDEVVVVGGSPETTRVGVVPASDVRLSEIAQMDGLRPLYRAEVRDEMASRAVTPADFARAMDRALITTSAELIGVGRWLLETSVAYAKERVQFDRPIGSFQGLQWELVDAAMEIERAAAAVAHAAMCVDADDISDDREGDSGGVVEYRERRRAVHVAKAEAGLAARVCARTGMQVHGGVGYTFEHGLHYWLRRAYAGDAFMGPSSHHHDRLADILFD